jgi:hypothetical protein
MLARKLNNASDARVFEQQIGEPTNPTFDPRYWPMTCAKCSASTRNSSLPWTKPARTGQPSATL